MKIATLLRLSCLLPALQLPAAALQLCVPELQELRAHDAADSATFGEAVAIDGDTAVLGAPYDSELGTSAGAAYVFVHDGTQWVEQAKLLAATGAAFDNFGSAVAVRGDTIVVGAPGNASGRAFVFVRSAGVWTQEAELAPPGGTSVRDFGGSVSLDGETAAVGAPAANGGPLGSAHVFVRQGGAWTHQAALVDPTPATSFAEEFGDALWLSGDVLAVGAPSASVSAGFSGAVVVYRRSGSSWTQEALIVPPDVGYKDYFGRGVALEGGRLVAGAPGQFYDGPAGAAYVYEEQAGVWSLRAKLGASDGTGGNQFGAALALSGDALVVGDWRDSAPDPFSGSAYAFHLVGEVWVELAKLGPADGAGSEYGASVAIDGGRALIGRPSAYDVGLAQGTAHAVAVPTPAGTAGCFCAAGTCGNPDPDAGCANSSGSGAAFVALGQTDPDELSFLVTGAKPKQFSAFFQADSSVAPFPFGDGLSCAGGARVALSALPLQLGPSGVLLFGRCAGSVPISTLGGVVPGSGATRSYQLWYRDPSGPCGATFNLTNAVEIVW